MPTPATNWHTSYCLLKDRRKTLDDLPCSPSTGHLSIHQRLPSRFIHSQICSFIPKSYKTPASVFWGHTGFFSSFLQTLWGRGVRRKGRNEKKGSPCGKEWSMVVKAQGTEENQRLLLCPGLLPLAHSIEVWALTPAPTLLTTLTQKALSGFEF